jgi:AAA15 family ATPase/GTPase
MLVEFSVTNFRSFASEQRLSLSAGRFKSERLGAVLDTPSKTSPHLLRAAAILGANGAGKSSLVGALEFAQQFVANSAQSTQRGDRIPVLPIKLDEKLENEPSSFELVFIFEGIEYQYSFSVCRHMVRSETLLARSQSKPLREVFSRSKTPSGEDAWNLGTLPKTQSKLWRQSTRDNALFLSTAVQLNSEELAKPFEWITQNLRIQTSEDPFFPSLTSHLIKDHVEDGCKQAVLNLLRESDLGIRDVVVEEETFDETSLPDEIPDEIRRDMVTEYKDRTFYSTRFCHRSKQLQSILFDYDEESAGTRRLYDMAGAWVLSLRHGNTLVVDEIEASLHPYIVRILVQMFQKPAQETSAQLIFTTHSDSLLDANILERDQFWFVEKRRGESELIPLLDYKPRKGEAMRQNYLRGRYGGVPTIAHVER